MENIEQDEDTEFVREEGTEEFNKIYDEFKDGA